jgi:hypothetical protein
MLTSTVAVLEFSLPEVVLTELVAMMVAVVLSGAARSGALLMEASLM